MENCSRYTFQNQRSSKIFRVEAFMEGRKRVVIGARSALFSVPKLGLIVWSEEGENTYKQDTSFFMTRGESQRRGSDYRSQVSHGNSATPSLNAWSRIQSV